MVKFSWTLFLYLFSPALAAAVVAVIPIKVGLRGGGGLAGAEGRRGAQTRGQL